MFTSEYCKEMRQQSIYTLRVTRANNYLRVDYLRSLLHYFYFRKFKYFQYFRSHIHTIFYATKARTIHSANSLPPSQPSHRYAAPKAAKHRHCLYRQNRAQVFLAYAGTLHFFAKKAYRSIQLNIHPHR